MTDLPAHWLPLRSMQTGKTQYPKYLRQPGDTTPHCSNPRPPVVSTYVPDPEPVLYPPMVARRLATSKELPQGARTVYNAAIRHGWIVDITYAYGYPPDSLLPVESYALRMTNGGRKAVGVWENNSVSTCYYWVGNNQPRKVTTTDLTGQRATEKRKFKHALLADGVGGPGNVATPRVPRQRPTPEVVPPRSVWAEVAEGDVVQGKGGSLWTVTSRKPDGRLIEVTVREQDGGTEVTASVKPDGTVHLMERSETRARIALEHAFEDVDPVATEIPANAWLVETQIEICRQAGVGCAHEVCKWDAQRRRRRHR